MEKIKILSLGLSQINFLEQLYGSIRKEDSNLHFDVDNFLNHGSLQLDEGIIENFFTFSDSKFSGYSKVKCFFKLLVKKSFWKQIFLETHSYGFKSIYKFIKKSVRDFYIASECIIPLNHDIYHFHSIVKPNVRYLQYLPNNKKIICSFWGLDLYQRWGTNNYYYISLALNKATVITVQSIEMKEVVLAKFGVNLRDKIKVITFPLKQDVFDLIDELKSKTEIQDNFKLKIGVKNLEKKIVSIGYNADSNSQHIPILEALNKLPKKVKETVIFILPLTYGRNEKYLLEIEKAIKKTKNLEVIKIESYLNWDELALLKIVTDVIIQMPLNDALSSAVLEVIYAGNTAITGNWLPYRVYKRNGIEHVELGEIADLIEVFNDDKNFESISEDNTQKIRDLFLSTEIIQKWIYIYKT